MGEATNNAEDARKVINKWLNERIGSAQPIKPGVVMIIAAKD